MRSIRSSIRSSAGVETVQTTSTWSSSPRVRPPGRSIGSDPHRLGVGCAGSPSRRRCGRGRGLASVARSLVGVVETARASPSVDGGRPRGAGRLRPPRPWPAAPRPWRGTPGNPGRFRDGVGAWQLRWPLSASSMRPQASSALPYTARTPDYQVVHPGALAESDRRFQKRKSQLGRRSRVRCYAEVRSDLGHEPGVLGLSRDPDRLVEAVAVPRRGLLILQRWMPECGECTGPPRESHRSAGRGVGPPRTCSRAFSCSPR